MQKSLNSANPIPRASITAPSRSSCLWIGDPTSNRYHLFEAARRRRGLPSVQVCSYLEVLADNLPEGSWDAVRLESPGKSLELEAAFITAGGGSVDRLEKGRIHNPAAWYSGFCQALEQLPEHWSYHNPPDDIRHLFDKRACHQRLAQAGLPVIPLAQPGERAFHKLFCGSSCSGALAQVGERVLAPLARRGPGCYYNSRRVSAYSGAVAREILDWFAQQGLHSERWLPKARLDGLDFDVRLLVVGGRSRLLVVRQGKTPMLGLQLGAKRGSVEHLRSWLGEHQWSELHRLGEGVASLFPRCLYLGMDLLVTPQRQLYIIEVNAFGDLLPGVQVQGLDSYDWELKLNSA